MLAANAVNAATPPSPACAADSADADAAATAAASGTASATGVAAGLPSTTDIGGAVGPSPCTYGYDGSAFTKPMRTTLPGDGTE